MKSQRGAEGLRTDLLGSPPSFKKRAIDMYEDTASNFSTVSRLIDTFSGSDDGGGLWTGDETPASGDKWSMEALMKRVEKLAAENSRLKEQAKERRRDEDASKPRVTIAYRWRTLYRLDGSIFLEEPFWSSGEAGQFVLRGQLPVSSTAEYLKRHEDIAFVAFKYYRPGTTLPANAQPGEDDGLPAPQPVKEGVRIVAPAMLEAMKAYLRNIPEFEDQFPDFDPSNEIPGPYLFWYYFRDRIKSGLENLPDDQKTLIKLFRDWIEGAYGSEWSYIDSQFEQGMVSPASMKYLIRPGDVLVSRKNRSIVSYMARNWMKPNNTPEVREMLAGRAEPVETDHSAIENEFASPENSRQKVTYTWSVESWAWSFDGSFRKAGKVLDLKLVTPSPRSSVPISSMEVFPLRFGDEELKKLLKKRGQKYWKFRTRMLVSYADQYGDEMSVVSNPAFWIATSC